MLPSSLEWLLFRHCYVVSLRRSESATMWTFRRMTPIWIWICKIDVRSKIQNTKLMIKEQWIVEFWNLNTTDEWFWSSDFSQCFVTTQNLTMNSFYFIKTVKEKRLVCSFVNAELWRTLNAKIKYLLFA